MIEKLEARRLLSNGPIINPFGSTLNLSNNTLVVSNKSVDTSVGGVDAGTSVAYTYLGDSSQLDTGNLDLSSGYDGLVNGDDYFLIDSNYASQSGVGIGQVSTSVNQNLIDESSGYASEFSGTAKNDRILITTDGSNSHLSINGKQFVTTSVSLRINGNSGDDFISIDLGSNVFDVEVTIYGGAGNDTIVGGTEADRIFAGDGNDIVNGGDGKDTIYGEAGDDSIRGGGSNDLIDGGDGADTLRGDAGNDNLSGGANSDRLRGSAGNDTLDGGGGRDLLAGEAGDDSLLGGAGDDKLDGGAGADHWDGGSGFDYIHAENGDASTSSFDDDVQYDQPDDSGISGSTGAILHVTNGASASTLVDAGGLTKVGSGTLILPGSTSGTLTFPARALNP